jgi:hypothetical protein
MQTDGRPDNSFTSETKPDRKSERRKKTIKKPQTLGLFTSTPIVKKTFDTPLAVLQQIQLAFAEAARLVITARADSGNHRQTAKTSLAGNAARLFQQVRA